jgi:hypothetical protein
MAGELVRKDEGTYAPLVLIFPLQIANLFRISFGRARALHAPDARYPPKKIDRLLGIAPSKRL